MKYKQVTVVFPQTFQFEIDERLSVEEIRRKIKEHASYLMETSQSEPIITECEDKKIVE